MSQRSVLLAGGVCMMAAGEGEGLVDHHGNRLLAVNKPGGGGAGDDTTPPGQLVELHPSVRSPIMSV